jgi:hypothetical protein
MGNPFEQIPHLREPKRLWRWMKFMPAPRLIREELVRKIRKLASPGETNARRALLSSVPKANAAIAASLEKNGYVVFPSSFSSSIESVVAELLAVFKAAQVAETGPQTASKKHGFLRALVDTPAFADHPAVMKFMIHPDLVNIASHYLGEVPVLSSARLWWSPANASAQSSQLYHFDEEDDRQLKFFLNITDVTTENGPFTLVSATVSAEIARHFGGSHGRFTDELVNRFTAKDNPTSFVGPRGTLSAVDTSRCLHFGSRGNKNDRVVLMFQYTKHSAPLGEAPKWNEKLIPMLAQMSPTQRRLFQYR